MDKSWMRADRRSNEYRSGVEGFIEFALVNTRDPYHICCPCTKCENDKDFSAQVIKTHLFLNGINLDYDIWDEHGEAVVNSESDLDRYSNEIDEDSETDSSGSSIVGGHMEAKCDVQSDSDGEEYLSGEYTGFRQFVDDGNKPLYPGCTTHTRMAVIVKLYNIKCSCCHITRGKSMLVFKFCDHWTLTVVDPDNDTVYFMDPVRRRIPCGDWAKIVKDAMVMANTARKRNGRSSMIPKNLAGMPFQPSDKECGYYVMGYMREIIEDKDTSRFVTKWDKRGSCKYTREYLDEVRNEWADFAVKKYVKEP
ncbi:hypothetical protein ACLB2K_004846 [Fragaria x ananassa]